MQLLNISIYTGTRNMLQHKGAVNLIKSRKQESDFKNAISKWYAQIVYEKKLEK